MSVAGADEGRVALLTFMPLGQIEAAPDANQGAEEGKDHEGHAGENFFSSVHASGFEARTTGPPGSTESPQTTRQLTI